MKIPIQSKIDAILTRICGVALTIALVVLCLTGAIWSIKLLLSVIGVI